MTDELKEYCLELYSIMREEGEGEGKKRRSMALLQKIVRSERFVEQMAAIERGQTSGQKYFSALQNAQLYVQNRIVARSPMTISNIISYGQIQEDEECDGEEEEEEDNDDEEGDFVIVENYSGERKKETVESSEADAKSDAYNEVMMYIGLIGDVLLENCPQSDMYQQDISSVLNSFPSQIDPLLEHTVNPSSLNQNIWLNEDWKSIFNKKFEENSEKCEENSEKCEENSDEGSFSDVVDEKGSSESSAVSRVLEMIGNGDRAVFVYRNVYSMYNYFSNFREDAFVNSFRVRKSKCLCMLAEIIWWRMEAVSENLVRRYYNTSMVWLGRAFKDRGSDFFQLLAFARCYTSYAQFLIFSDIERFLRESLYYQNVEYAPAELSSDNSSYGNVRVSHNDISPAKIQSEEQEIRLWKLINNHFLQVSHECFLILDLLSNVDNENNSGGDGGDNSGNLIFKNVLNLWLFSILRQCSIMTVFSRSNANLLVNSSRLYHSLELFIYIIITFYLRLKKFENEKKSIDEKKSLDDENKLIDKSRNNYIIGLSLIITYNNMKEISNLGLKGMKYLAQCEDVAAYELVFLMRRRGERREMIREFVFREIEALPDEAYSQVLASKLRVDDDILPNYEAFVGGLFFQTGVKMRDIPNSDVDPFLIRIRYICNTRDTIRQKRRGRIGRVKLSLNRSEIDLLMLNNDPTEVYRDFRPIGKGGYGEVYIARRRGGGGGEFAVKRIPFSDNSDMKHVHREILTLRDCRHPNIVQFIECFSHRNYVWLIMEYCDGGSLSQLKKRGKLREKEIAYVCREVLKALEYLHINDRVHRDVKSANVLLNVSGSVKLADLGLVDEIAKGSRSLAMAGSRNFMAPEMVRRVGYDAKIDIWSLGCMIHEVFSRPPYYGEPPLRVLFNLATIGAPPLPPNKSPPSAPSNFFSSSSSTSHGWSQNFVNFTNLCLTMDPASRPSASELLEHSFIQNAASRNDICKIFEKAFIRDALAVSGLL